MPSPLGAPVAVTVCAPGAIAGTVNWAVQPPAGSALQLPTNSLSYETSTVSPAANPLAIALSVAPAVAAGSDNCKLGVSLKLAVALALLEVPSAETV